MTDYICEEKCYWESDVWKPGMVYSGDLKPPKYFRKLNENADLEVEVTRMKMDKPLIKMTVEELLGKAADLKMVLPNGLPRPKLIQQISAKLKMDKEIENGNQG
jgi:hypothetical protein